jgi:predicted small lipoprotein YifL
MVCLGVAAAALAGCGQRGPLYLPKDPAAANRATLPDLMTPRMPGASSDAAAPAPAGASSAPAVPGAAR